MLKVKLLLSACLLSILNATQIQILAKNIDINKTTIKATNSVNIRYLDYQVNSEHIELDINRSILQIRGTNQIFGDKEFIANSSGIDINLKNKTSNFTNLNIDFNKTNIWINNKSCQSNQTNFILKKSVVSSCNKENPDWKIKFSTGKMNRENKFVSLYNPIFYIKNIPILWLPYFGFSANTSRTSGLLNPQFSRKSDDGFIYFQPIFFALDPSYDLELTPQLRTLRGMGMYADFRFVDSNHSKGNIEAGIFKENNTYASNQNLENRTHYGVELHYTKDHMTNKPNYTDGLYVDINYLNDIDYINLKSRSNNNFDKLVDSKINYFLRNDKQYFGIYSNYYIDTAKPSNQDTIQVLPTVEYNIFHNKLYKQLYYSLNANLKNYYRPDGINAVQGEFTLPIHINYWLWHKYLNVDISQNTYLSYAHFLNDNNDILDQSYSNYFSNYFKISLDSSIIKKYKNIYHSINNNIDFILPSYSNINQCSSLECNFIDYEEPKKSINFQLSQFFYTNDKNIFLTHRLSQSYLYDEHFGDLKNELIYKNSNFNFFNTLTYSHKNDKFNKLFTQIELKNRLFNSTISHNYEYTNDLNKSNYLLAKIDTNISTNYNIFSKVKYDLQKSLSTEWEFGIIMKKKCWSYEIDYKKEIEPIFQSNGINSKTKHSVSLTITFFPIGKIKYNKETLLE